MGPGMGCLVLLILNAICTTAQTDSVRTISAVPVQGEVVVDGLLSEEAWRGAAVATHFYNQFPYADGLAKNRTEVRVLVSDEFLYVGMTAYFDPGHKPVIQSLKRDSPWEFSDAFTLVVDPSGAGNSGMLFDVNAGGAQADAMLSTQGVFSDFDVNWDAQWFSEVTRTETYWVAEMAIPFRMLRYKESNRSWVINFVRHDMQYNVTTAWNYVPVNLNYYTFLYAGRLEWATPPPAFRQNVFLAPFVTSEASKPDLASPLQKTFDAGIDAKIPLSSSLNLDVTVNPDFSQVDVDQQVINLTRFDVFFPERRAFFLENSDLFANMGVFHIRPFFSRKIGLKDGKAVPLPVGLKLTGNVNPRLRVGLLNILEQEVKDSVYNNYSVAAFQQAVLKNSIVQGIFTNIQTMDRHDVRTFDYNRSAGLEFKWLSDNQHWNLIGRYHKAFREDIADKNAYAHLGATYNVKKWYVDLNVISLGENYVNDLGFTPTLYQYDPVAQQTNRIGFVQNFTDIRYRIFPEDQGKVAYRAITLTADSYLRGDNELNESDVVLGYEVLYRNQSTISMGVRHTFVDLFYPLSLLGGEFTPLEATRYNFQTVEGTLESNPTRQLSYSLFGAYGSFYNGTRFTLSPSAKLRMQPWGNFNVYYHYNQLKFPGVYGQKEFHLIGSSVEILFSNRMFWTTFFQYNTQIENVNINSRFQWRYRPLSDLFVVYTDNYTDTFIGKNRGVVVKLVYWFPAGGR